MSLLKRIFHKCPLVIRIKLRENLGYKNINETNDVKNQLREVYHSYVASENKGICINDDSKIWYEGFKKFIIAQPKEADVAFEFFKNNIKIIKLSNLIENDKLILLCVVKDDLIKLKELIKHHREIGVKHFAILDNGSQDGTIEWLKMQNDVDILQVFDKYTTNRREAWLNRLIAFYGLNKWYLIVDSDEMFVYNDMENTNINQLINYCEKNKIFRLRALMVDMYARKDFYIGNDNSDYVKKCKYFDLDTYSILSRDHLDLVVGGPRKRVFNQVPWLTKYPLSFFSNGDIQGKSHFGFPYKKNKNTKCLSALLHYKFLPQDIKKYERIAQEGSYFNGSIQYKSYINHINAHKIDFFCDCSEKYVNSESIYKINVMESIIF